MRRFKSIMAVALAVVMLCSVNVVPAQAATNAKVTSVKAVSPAGSKKIAYVAKGKSIKLSSTVKVKPASKATKAMKKVTWKSANSSIATVSKKGVVKGKKLGTTKITVTSVKSKKKATIKMKVVNPVKKVSLNKSKLTLTVGNSATLKASVTAPKKSFKKVKWTSSNKKVATVTKKGVVKAVSEGTAKITAKAYDGSKKKASCTVTVQKSDTNSAENNNADTNNSLKLSINNIEFIKTPGQLYADVMRVTLDSEKVLTKEDFTAKQKKCYEGNYNADVIVEGVVTSDNITYFVFVEKDINHGEYLQLNISSGDENCTFEKQFICDEYINEEKIYSTVAGYSTTYYLGTSDYLCGYVSTQHMSGTLPQGISYYPSAQKISGKCETVVDNEEVVYNSVDEMGLNYITKLTYVVGDENTITAENKKVGFTEKDKLYVGEEYSTFVYAVGGSKKYDVTLIDTYDGKFSLDSTTSTYHVDLKLSAEKNTEAGTYTVGIKFTDQENPELSDIATVTIKIQESYNVTTTINNMGAKTVCCFYNINTGESFKCKWGSKDETGGIDTYSHVIPAGNYIVYNYTYDKRRILSNVIEITGDAELEFTMEQGANITVNVYDKDGNLYTDQLYMITYASDKAFIEYNRFYFSGGSYTFINIPKGKYIIAVMKNYSTGEGSRRTGEIVVTDEDVEVNIYTDYE